MLERYLYFKNILKYEIWWTTKNEANTNLNFNTVYFLWKGKYFFFFNVIYNLFKNLLTMLYILLKKKQKILVFYKYFFTHKEFFVFNHKIFIFSCWLRGLLTNLEVLRWNFLYKSGFLFLKKHMPSLIFLLGQNEVLLKESLKLQIPTISIDNRSTYQLTPLSNKNLIYFYFSFLFTIVNLIKNY